MLRYKTKTRPGLVAYDIRPGNGAGPFVQPRSPHGAVDMEMSGKTNSSRPTFQGNSRSSSVLTQIDRVYR